MDIAHERRERDRKNIEAAMEAGNHTLAEIAQATGLKPRTTLRRLKEMGVRLPRGRARKAARFRGGAPGTGGGTPPPPAAPGGT